MPVSPKEKNLDSPNSGQVLEASQQQKQNATSVGLDRSGVAEKARPSSSKSYPTSVKIDATTKYLI